MRGRFTCHGRSPLPRPRGGRTGAGHHGLLRLQRGHTGRHAAASVPEGEVRHRQARVRRADQMLQGGQVVLARAGQGRGHQVRGLHSAARIVGGADRRRSALQVQASFVSIRLIPTGIDKCNTKIMIDTIRDPDLFRVEN
jgi:hypothetical protein